MKKALIIIISLAALVLLILYFIPISYPLKKTMTAIEIRHNDPQHIVQREIQIDGQYSLYLFKPDSFRGDLVIEGYDFTKNHEPSEIQIQNETTMLAYFKFGDDFGIIPFGPLLATRNFREVFIGVYENNGWGGGDGLSLFAPASTKGEAKAVWQTLSSIDPWVGASNWPE